VECGSLLLLCGWVVGTGATIAASTGRSARQVVVVDSTWVAVKQEQEQGLGQAVEKGMRCWERLQGSTVLGFVAFGQAAALASGWMGHGQKVSV